MHALAPPAGAAPHPLAAVAAACSSESVAAAATNPDPPATSPPAGPLDPPASTSAAIASLTTAESEFQPTRVYSGALRRKPARILVDSGSSGNFVSSQFISQHSMQTQPSKQEVRLANGVRVHTSGTLPAAHLSIGSYQTATALQVADIEGYDVILGQPWLRKVNPAIDWTSGRAVITQRGHTHTLRPMHAADTPGSGIHVINALTYLREAHPTDKVYLLTINASAPQPSGAPPKADAPPWERLSPGTDPQAVRLVKLFADLFPDDLPPGLPPQRGRDYTIDLEPGHAPPCPHVYRLAPDELDELRSTLETLVEKKFIQPSTSPFGAPILFVKKKDGSKRMVIDYRALNKITVKNKYPLPLIDELLDVVAGSTIWTSLDLMSGYHQVRVAPEDTHKTAFRTRYGSYEFRVMPFGVTNAPSHFSAMMMDVLRPYLDKFVVVYIDDILIFSKSPAEHQEHVQLVLQRLREAKLYAKLSKCNFFQRKVNFLGYILTPDGISPDPSKLQAVQQWPVPTTVQAVQRFLGFANFYRRFVKDYSSIAAPLTDLTKHGSGTTPVTWTPAADAAFKALKQALSTPPVLQPFNPSLPTKITTDASDVGIGAELAQLHGKAWLPVAYLSRKLSPAEGNYPTHDKELLAIIHAFKSWSHYLSGRPFDVYTDHHPLRYLQSQPTLSKRQARWLDTLAEFDYTVKYIPGPSNHVADALSRQLCALTASAPTNLDLQRRIIDAYPSDPTTSTLIQALRSDDPPANSDYTLADNGLLLELTSGNPRVYVPNDPPLRTMLLHEHHDAAGHFGTAKTLDLLERHYYWPRMRATVEDYVRSCEPCQRNKAVNAKPYGPLQPLPVPPSPWHTVTMDLISGLPVTTTGYDAVTVFVDKLTKMIHLAAVKKASSATDLASVFFNHVYRHHGLPKVIVSDRDSRFTGHFWQHLFKLCGTRLALSTAYHPQTDGQTERANRTLVEALRTYVNAAGTNWDRQLTAIEFAYNNSVNASTGYSPFYLNAGRNPDAPAALAAAQPPTTASPAVDAFVESQRAAVQQAQQSLLKAQSQQKQQADRHRRDAPFAVGDSVLLSTANLDLRKSGKSRKLLPRWIGPFAITRQAGAVSFELALTPPYTRLHPVFHASLLRPHVPSDAAQFPDRTAATRPPPDMAGGDEQTFVAAEIRGKRARRARNGRRVTEYLVHWEGYPDEDDTWEPARHLKPPLAGASTWSLVQAYVAAH